MSQSFSLEQFIRNSGETHFSMTVVENQEQYLEMEIRGQVDPTNVFSIYIERDVVFGKTALDGFKKHFGGLMHKADRKFNVKNLYKDMKR